MKKINILFLVALILVSSVFAESYEGNISTMGTYNSDYASLDVKSLKYEPYPANPGEYVNLWIKIENIGKISTENAYFELVPKYPFSLDSNENAVRELGKLGAGETAVLEYKVRIDEDAIGGNNEIQLRYNTDGKDKNWEYQEFNIQLEDSQTDFDLVLQEVSGNEVSIAIANIGENIAYSVIVRIPEQDAFKIVGTSGQMVGNLENGDYTLVGFEITQDKKMNDEPLKVRIDYTDEIGERRSVIKNVDYINQEPSATLPGAVNSDVAGGVRNNYMRVQTQTSIYQKWWFWGIIIIIGIGSWKGYKIYKTKKLEKEEKKHKR